MPPTESPRAMKTSTLGVKLQREVRKDKRSFGPELVEDMLNQAAETLGPETTPTAPTPPSPPMAPLAPLFAGTTAVPIGFCDRAPRTSSRTTSPASPSAFFGGGFGMSAAGCS